MAVLEDARRLAALVHADPCGGVPRRGLESALGWPEERFKPALFCAYRARWIDFIQDYVVVSTAPNLS